MKLQAPFRSATVGDCHKIAELFRIASDGVTDYLWSTMLQDYPGLTPLEIGAKRYADEQNIFGYKNCIVIESNREVIGMMNTFPIAPTEARSENELQRATAEPFINEPDVLAPYSLEAPNTWYICALAIFPEFRNQGLGTQLLTIARQQAKENGFSEVSLLCFEQNVDALRLYHRNGFKEIDRTPVVPHELIHYTGDVLLMTQCC